MIHKLQILKDFIRRCPISSFAKTFFGKNRSSKVVFLYEDGEASKCLISENGRALFFSKRFSEVDGSPGVGSWDNSVVRNNSAWRQICKRCFLGLNNPTVFGMPLEKMYFGLHDINFKGTGKDFLSRLPESPQSLIPTLPKSSGEKVWLVLDDGLNFLDENATAPKRVILFHAPIIFLENLSYGAKLRGLTVTAIVPLLFLFVSCVFRFRKELFALDKGNVVFAMIGVHESVVCQIGKDSIVHLHTVKWVLESEAVNNIADEIVDLSEDCSSILYAGSEWEKVAAIVAKKTQTPQHAIDETTFAPFFNADKETLQGKIDEYFHILCHAVQKFT